MENTLKNIRQFIFAGKAIFTVKNEQTGKWFTFKVSSPDEENSQIRFVSVLSGCDNESDYSYMGLLKTDLSFFRTKKSRISEDSLSFRSFSWFIRNIEKLPSNVSVYHAGKCGRCGRTLTTPESVENGFGPECVKHVG
jgi:hypothetical protein